MLCVDATGPAREGDRRSAVATPIRPHDGDLEECAAYLENDELLSGESSEVDGSQGDILCGVAVSIGYIEITHESILKRLGLHQLPDPDCQEHDADDADQDQDAH